MKNPSLWFTALVLALGGYTFWEYKHAQQTLDAAQGEKLAFSLNREEIDFVALTHKGETAELKREGDKWLMLKPVADEAEGSAVEGFLFGAVAQKLKTFRSEDSEKSVDWKQYDLDPAETQLVLRAKGKTETLMISGKSAFDGSYYVRLGDELLLGDRSLAQLAQRPASAFRSRHLWRESDVELERVSSRGDGSDLQFQFVKKDGQWQMDPAPPYAIDRSKFESWVNRVQDFLPNDFVKEEITDEDRRQSLLQKPSQVLTIDFKHKDGRSGQWTLTLGQEKSEEIFLYTNQRPTLYKTTRASLQPIRVGVPYFRDGKQPFQFDVEQAREVLIQAQKTNVHVKKSDSGWVLVDGPNKAEELSQDKLVQLMTSLKALEAQEFNPKGSSFKQSSTVEVRGDKGQVLLKLTWGDEFKATSPWNAGKAMRFAKVSGKDILGLDKATLDRLVPTDLVKTKK